MSKLNKRMNMIGLLLLDENGAVAQEYRVSGIPTSFFISHERVIQVQYTGPLNESLIEKHLGQIL